ncbi:Uncharacterized protein dnm_026130 [Desulfonema magnum]|uniref:Uncharacterized protein n=1 Tax=Desulfonema magnum TaxID=45655 RepID=A0A975BK81_9BACT|nr:Uncharacterized protein dnm_026130 [Desulfonema magnum]
MGDKMLPIDNWAEQKYLPVGYTIDGVLHKFIFRKKLKGYYLSSLRD